MSDHEWQECQPIVVDLKPGNGQTTAAEAIAALAMAWSLVTDDDRRLFHAYCCLNVHNDETHAAIGRISELVRLAMEGE